MCYLRRRFEEQFAEFAGTTSPSRTYIGAEEVKLFLLKQTYKSFLFLSETMDIFKISDRSSVGLAVSSKPSCQPIWLKVPNPL